MYIQTNTHEKNCFILYLYYYTLLLFGCLLLFLLLLLLHYTVCVSVPKYKYIHNQYILQHNLCIFLLLFFFLVSYFTRNLYDVFDEMPSENKKSLHILGVYMSRVPSATQIQFTQFHYAHRRLMFAQKNDMEKEEEEEENCLSTYIYYTCYHRMYNTHIMKALTLFSYNYNTHPTFFFIFFFIFCFSLKIFSSVYLFCKLYRVLSFFLFFFLCFINKLN